MTMTVKRVGRKGGKTEADGTRGCARSCVPARRGAQHDVVSDTRRNRACEKFKAAIARVWAS